MGSVSISSCIAHFPLFCIPANEIIKSILSGSREDNVYQEKLIRRGFRGVPLKSKSNYIIISKVNI